MKKSIKKNNKSKENKQTIVCIVLTIFSIFALSTSLFIYSASQPKQYEYGIYKTGTPITAGSATVTINNINYDQGISVFKAPAGMQYLLLDSTFKNISDKSINILPSTQTYIKGEDGRVYYLTLSALEEPFRAGELMAGDKITGQLSYLVPKNTTYTLYIDAIWSGGVVSARLN